jgi:hypothetical protein
VILDGGEERERIGHLVLGANTKRFVDRTVQDRNISGIAPGRA